MVCSHLKELEQELISRGIKETYRGKAWSDNCREWVYFDCYLNIEKIRARIDFDPCVVDHEHRGTHDGSESGFECSEHRDAIMGVHPAYAEGKIEIG